MTNLANLSAVILCGGLGTRLREETEFKPKPMVEIGDKPILWHIMKQYRHFGVRNFVLCIGYKGDVIRDYFLNYPLYNSDFAIDFKSGDVETLSDSCEEDWRLVLAETGAETQTGTRIKRALRYAEGDLILATYGDGVSNVDLDRLLAHHRASGKLATVTAVRPSSRFGELAIEDNLVTNFREKPQVAEGWINGGFFVFDKRAFDRVRPVDDVSLEDAVLETLANQGELAVYKHHGFWQSMDTFREMTLLNEMWAAGNAPWNIWEECRLTA
ncbi:MAG: glucose-1-phosphate cytidylyltransferase [Rhodospirillaceae bacterium]|jgi:glucose-1-phosphate cytidylyltransferase|nr:glucose-1-phosphate cytidylyltransferase [Rhodospirillaceae bacterium]